jgi:hypothetical protein
MPSRSKSHRLSGPVRARLLSVLIAALFCLVSTRAHAAAPFCDPSGASAIAPIPVLPNATGDLEAPKNCDDSPHAATDVTKPRHDSPNAERGVDVPDRAIVTPGSLPDVQSARTPGPDRVDSLHLPGHTLEVFRPPRA